MEKITRSAALAILLMLATVTLVYAVSVNWGASNNPIYDQTGVGGTVLANGDIVQLIWDQGNDGIDPPDSLGAPTGDDQLLATSAIGVGTFFPGRFSANLNTNLIGVGNQIYVRAWNAGTIAAATHYGDSPLATVTSNTAFTFDATAASSFATTVPTGQLAVTLASFEATCQGDWILVAWETVSELDNRGFNLWRGTVPAEPDIQLNPYLIPSQSQGSPTGFVYSWEDHFDVLSGVTYYYWVEDIDVNGVVTRHGPVSAICGVPTAVSLGELTAGPAPLRSNPVALLSLAIAASSVLGYAAHKRGLVTAFWVHHRSES